MHALTLNLFLKKVKQNSIIELPHINLNGSHFFKLWPCDTYRVKQKGVHVFSEGRGGGGGGGI